MTLQLLYWVLMIIWAVFGFWSGYGQANPARVWGGNFLIFILLLILGWQVFGAPVKT